MFVNLFKGKHISNARSNYWKSAKFFFFCTLIHVWTNNQIRGRLAAEVSV